MVPVTCYLWNYLTGPLSYNWTCNMYIGLYFLSPFLWPSPVNTAKSSFIDGWTLPTILHSILLRKSWNCLPPLPSNKTGITVLMVYWGEGGNYELLGKAGWDSQKNLNYLNSNEFGEIQNGVQDICFGGEMLLLLWGSEKVWEVRQKAIKQSYFIEWVSCNCLQVTHTKTGIPFKSFRLLYFLM